MYVCECEKEHGLDGDPTPPHFTTYLFLFLLFPLHTPVINSASTAAPARAQVGPSRGGGRSSCVPRSASEGFTIESLAISLVLNTEPGRLPLHHKQLMISYSESFHLKSLLIISTWKTGQIALCGRISPCRSVG